MKTVLRILTFIIFLAAILYVKALLAKTTQDPNDTNPQNPPALDLEWAGCALKYEKLNGTYFEATATINKHLKLDQVTMDSETCFLILQSEMVIAYVGDTCLDLGIEIQKTKSPNKAFVTGIDQKILKSVKTFREIVDIRTPVCKAIKKMENEKKPQKPEIY
jgi:hypothetical protein